MLSAGGGTGPMAMRTTVKLAIVEDHRATMNYLTALFHGTEGIEVVGSYATGRDAVEGLRRTLPNVILADLGLPDMSGLEVIASIKEYFPLVEIIVLTMHEDREHLLAAVRTAVAGGEARPEPAHGPHPNREALPQVAGAVEDRSRPEGQRAWSSRLVGERNRPATATGASPSWFVLACSHSDRRVALNS